MTVWTIQAEEFWESLQRRDTVRAKWRNVSTRRKPAYIWMAQQMVRLGCCTRLAAPIWAWHSCHGLGQPPNRETVEALFGWDGRKVLSIELQVPERIALLSQYGVWNDILDEVADMEGEEARLDPVASEWDRVFRVSVEERRHWGDDNREDIQACMPYVKREWVQGMKAYTLPSF